MAFETISLGTQPAGTGGDTARTAFEKVNRNFIAADVLAAAMSQAQFEANRNANKELYAASGWVSFGNHESGKQVNECKPGLYTALTTPNTLLIGKSGGVGGSKTDYASVHIDGVVFNLTNQFVLTLPSHPNSVLPERMDMYGVESEKVEISSASPNAYQGGLRGVGTAVNLFSATDQQKKDFFAQNSNTTFIGSDGKIYQWQLYKVAFAGTTGGVPSPTEQGYSLNSFGDLWLKAGKNLLYFGNVLRLNDGGYHPSFNPLGAAKFVGDTFWYNTATSITSEADCFNPSKLLAGSGSIASGKSGRPEIGGRYYDAVYADGYGGVCRDMRYSANGVDLIYYEEINQKVNIGEYRGFEESIFSKPFPLNSAVFSGGKTLVRGDGVHDFFGGPQDLNKTKKLNGYIIDFSAQDGISQYAYLIEKYGDVSGSINSAGGLILSSSIQGKLVGGSFLKSDVIGTPLNIASTSAISGGWDGSWVNPYGPENDFSKKFLFPYGTQTYTANNGGSWISASLSINEIVNSVPAISINLVLIAQYQAFAKQTQSASNAAINGLLPYNVFASSDYQPANGALLGESLIGKVLKNNSGVSVNNKSLLSCAIDGTGKLTSAASFDGLTHSPLTLGTPANNSPAFKVVSYLANINQQAVPHFAYTELKHNGTSFGDDGKQTIIDNQSTKPNDHNVTVSVGTARLREPIGWFKNKV
ncbi:hypothetical protein [Shewanella sp. ISTPL2]|uniref:hypothetical protein n=1 Tax=Shewanella sp. ISTPL2 TaxID=2699425 RepID=UPI001569E2A5|nr:hypothetical protein [Shewanella sp. ISTPL2]